MSTATTEKPNTTTAKPESPEKERPSNALAPTQAGGPLAAHQEELDGGLLAFWDGPMRSVDNFEGEPDEKFRMQMKCMSDAEKGADHLNTTIVIRYWMVHEIQIVKDDGEVVDCLRVVLVTPEGQAIAFVSGVLAKSVRSICHHYGRSPLNPGLPVVIKQKNIDGGKRCYVMAPAEEPAKKK